MTDNLPVAIRQLLANPVLLLLFATLLAAFVLLSRFLLTRPRGWRWRDLTARQAVVVLILLDIIVGMGWALTFDYDTVYGTFQYYLHAALFFGFWTLFVVTGPVASLAATRALAPHRAGPHW